MSYSIIYSSRTGNTKLLADKIQTVKGSADCKYFGPIENADLDADIIYIGFWTDKGRADDECLEFLKTIRNKNIFIFGTCGFGKEQSYFDRVIANTAKAIDSSNALIGSFICQGKMPMRVREKYVEMKKKAFHMPNIDSMIENFDHALSHPDNKDLENLEIALTKAE